METDSRKVILFGAGRDGREALDFFGVDRVFCYVDNDPDRAGTISYKKIISVQDLKKIVDSCGPDFQNVYEVVITIGVSRWAAFTVAQQLRTIGLERFSIYSDIKRRWKNGKEFLARDIVVYPCEQESILEIYKYQLDWMIRHTKASDLKPAEGKMRETQMKCMSGLKWLLQKVDSLDLKFIMNHGTLIGALRHKGFIPWDDDMDLALISDEYEKFVAFCEADDDIVVFYNCFNGEYRTKSGERSVSPEEHPYIMAYGRGYVQFFYNVGEEECKANELITDIMPLYYVSDEVDLDTYAQGHNKYTSMRKEEFDKVDYIFDKGEYEEDIFVSKSSQVGYKFDFTSFFDWHNAKTGRSIKHSLWSADCLYPLQKTNFEDIQLWIPRRPKEWLQQINPGSDIMAIPRKSVGIPVHNKDDIWKDKF